MLVDALGVWFGMVKFCARAGKINEIAKEVAMHFMPEGLVNARHELLARRDAEVWTFLRHLKDNL